MGISHCILGSEREGESAEIKRRMYILFRVTIIAYVICMFRLVEIESQSAYGIIVSQSDFFTLFTSLAPSHLPPIFVSSLSTMISPGCRSLTKWVRSDKEFL